MLQFLKNNTGNVTISFALAAVAMFSVAGAAVDYLMLVRSKTELQAIADSASLAGASSLAENWLKPDALKSSKAKAAATAHVTYEAKSRMIEVEAESDLIGKQMHVKLHMTSAPSLGLLPWSRPHGVAARSTAAFDLRVPDSCVITLNKDAAYGLRLEGSASLAAAGCSVWSNSTSSTSMSFSASTAATAKHFCAAGTVSARGTVTPPPQDNCPAMDDPFADRDFGSLPTRCDYPATTIEGKNAPKTLKPGVYCGGLIIRQNVKLNPGLYVIRNGKLEITGGTTVTAEGVSFFLSGKSYFYFAGNTKLNVTAMTTGPMAGLALAVDPASTLDSTITGNDAMTVAATEIKSTGSIYVPKARVTITGSSDVSFNGINDKLVVGSLAMAGNGKLKTKGVDSTPVGGSRTVRLIK